MPRVALVLSMLAACAVDDTLDATGTPLCLDCDETPPPPAQGAFADRLEIAPPSLAETGFYSLERREFKPRWALWSDGAEKRRWIALPAGTTIDSSRTDYWQFPVGTRLWKDFVRDGVRVETRYMARYGAGEDDWIFMAYAWSSDDSDATAVPDGAMNARGTAHDIPAQDRCPACHANVASRVLGFGALQLDYDAAGDLVDLDVALAEGWLSASLPVRSPRFPVPGTQQQRAALGYFHANCGHCHNSRSPLINRPMFRLEVDYLATVSSTRTYRSTINVPGTPYGGASLVAKPGYPDQSIIVTRMKSSDTKKRMPWLGGEVVDPSGLALVRAWIANP